MVAWQCDCCPEARKRRCLHASNFDLVGGQSDIELASRDQVLDHRRHLRLKRDGNVRMPLLEATKRFRDNVRAESREAGDLDLAGAEIANSGGGAAQMDKTGKRLLHLPEEEATLRRGRHSTLYAMEQEKTDFPFKLLNGLADGGLGNPQDVGRPRGRTIGHNGVENLDLSNVHNHNPDE